MKVTAVLIAVILSVVLQVTLARYTVGGRLVFDVVLVGVVYSALQWGPVAGMLAGTIGGLLQDMLAGEIVGVGGLAKTLVGCAAGGGSELGDTALARRRAMEVEGYLRDVWGIEPERMRIVARDLPAKPSDAGDRDGLAENRRVEIEADDPAILAPVVTDDTLRLADPPLIRFAPVTRGAGLAWWRLTVAEPGRVLEESGGEGSAPGRIEWRPSDDDGNMPGASGLITYVLDVRDSAGRSSIVSGIIPVELVSIGRKRSEGRADREIDRYGMILFDFDRSDLSDANRAIAAGIRARIAPGSRVTIEGSTDRTGDEAHNRRLSASRASAVARALGLDRVVTRGLGESSAHDNDLPEGRFYCRTVTVVAESPRGGAMQHSKGNIQNGE